MLTVPAVLVAQPLGQQETATRPAMSRHEMSAGSTDTARTTTDTTSLGTITTDTGTLAPGHRDFAHYGNVRLCWIAARREIEIGRGNWSTRVYHDTVTDRTRDTLPTRVAVVGRACSTRFTVTNTPAQDLIPLFELALLDGNDSLARAVEQRLVLAIPTPAGRITGELQFIDQYLKAEPVRYAIAESIAAAIDAQHPTDFSDRVAAHEKLLVYAGNNYWTDYVERDTMFTRREAEHLIQIGHEVPATTIQHDVTVAEDVALGVNDAYAYLEKLALHTELHTGTGVEAVAQRARQDFQKFAVDGGFKIRKWRVLLLGSEPTITNSTPIDSVVRGLFWIAYLGKYASMEPAPKLRADFWFPATPGDDLQPKPGVYNFYVMMRGIFERRVDEYGNFEHERFLRSEIAQWMKDGIRVTVTDTLSDRGSMRPLAEEAKNRADSIRARLHVPVNVALTIVHINVLPAPDGRLGWVDTTHSDFGIQPGKKDNLEGMIYYWITPDGRTIRGYEKYYRYFHPVDHVSTIAPSSASVIRPVSDTSSPLTHVPQGGLR